MPSLIQRASGVIFAAWISSIAAVYHIGPARADKTFAAVVGKLNPGDTLYVDGNATYAAVTFTRPGTAAAPIVVQGLAAEGKRPLISGGANTVHFQSDDPYDHGADHYVFQGFEITGGAGAGTMLWQGRDIPAFGGKPARYLPDGRRTAPGWGIKSGR